MTLHDQKRHKSRHHPLAKVDQEMPQRQHGDRLLVHPLSPVCASHARPRRHRFFHHAQCRPFFKRLAILPDSWRTIYGMGDVRGFTRMCLVFINFQPDGKGPLMIGPTAKNRDGARPLRRSAANKTGCDACSPAPITARMARSPPWGPGWVLMRPAWPWRSPIAMTASSHGPINFAPRPARRVLARRRSSQLRRPDRPSEIAKGGYGGCNFLIASAIAAFVVQAPGPTRISTSSSLESTR